MSGSILEKFENKYKKHQVVDVRSGDTVKVHQKIREGNKERVQVFQGLVIRTDRTSSHTSRITVRRLASGIGVEKSFLLHSPLVTKVEIVKRSKVRRNYLSYMKALTGKATRLSGVDFDKETANKIDEIVVPAEEVVAETAPEPEIVEKTEKSE
ncbi:MAG TPA: 50S ribosomal protein L19 [Candidatus Saccharimonadales bacterium]